MTIKITPVSTASEITLVEQLAKEIWSQHYSSIIGLAQVKYMIKTFQSFEAISFQIQDGVEYYLVTVDKRIVGYLSLVLDYPSKRLMLSKIYVKQLGRKKGVGKSMLDFVEEKCTEEGLDTLWLTVNRFNDDAIIWYKNHGFNTVDEVKKDIGSGFFMDDYIMEKKIKTTSSS